MFTIYTCYIQLLLLCTTFIRFINPPPPGNGSLCENDPSNTGNDPLSKNDPSNTNDDFFFMMIPQQNAPFPQVNNQLPSKENTSKKLMSISS